MNFRVVLCAFLLIVTARGALACICVSAPQKWNFKYSDAVVVVRAIDRKCFGRVRIVTSFKSPFRVGEEISVVGEDGLSCVTCVRGERSLLYLYRWNGDWKIGGCDGIPTDSEHGRAQVRLLRQRAWWWRMSVSSVGLFPVRRWWQERLH
jgi:hypothetical protein